jgi:hypothetical protein
MHKEGGNQLKNKTLYTQKEVASAVNDGGGKEYPDPVYCFILRKIRHRYKKASRRNNQESPA